MRNIVDFLGVNVDVIDTEALYRQLLDFVKNGQPRQVMYVNADCMLLSIKDEEYRQILNSADLVYADGVGVAWGARLVCKDFPNRSTAADFMPSFCQRFAQEGVSIYMLGARPGVAEAAASKLKEIAPTLKIAGTHHGYFGENEMAEVIENIVQSNPDILLIALGAPHQEKWIKKNFSSLNIPVVWGVGGLLDFLSGRINRGPQWLLDNGLEWLCRLFVEPGRLWKRYLIGNTKFLYHLLRWRF